MKGKMLSAVAKRLAKRSSCGVKGCNSQTDVTVVELKPFDPIDHESTFVSVCAQHQVWADERNAFAEEMADELREKRKEIGQANIGRIQDLHVPQGQMREDILMGDADGQIPLDEAFDETQHSLTESDVLEDSNE